MTLQLRRCPKCKQDKPLSQFNRDKHDKTGLTVYCKACCLDYKRQYQAVGRIEKKFKQIQQLNDSIDQMADVVAHILAIKQQLLKSISKKGIK